MHGNKVKNKLRLYFISRVFSQEVIVQLTKSEQHRGGGWRAEEQRRASGVPPPETERMLCHQGGPREGSEDTADFTPQVKAKSKRKFP